MNINSKDYHDYVFKNGVLIGEFDQMYQKSKGIPWNQDKASEQWFNKISLAIIKRALDDPCVKSIHEIGCGLGYCISNFRNKGYELSGSDISKVAIFEAKRKFSKINFVVDDIRVPKKRPCYDLVLINALFWYVFPQLKNVLKNIDSMVHKGGYVFIAESFPKLSSNFVGKKIIPNPEKLADLFSDFLNPIVDARVIKMEYPKDGPNFYWLGKKINK